MKILQIAPASPYNEGWGYQENLLPKYQARLGNEVWIVVTNKKFEDGELITVAEEDYVSKDGFRVIRKAKKRFVTNKLTELLSYVPVYKLLYDYKPDLIFCHGLSNLTLLELVRYKKQCNPNTIIVADNHADYNIGPKRTGIDGKLIRWFWRKLTHLTIKNIDKVYGVTPWRKQFVQDYYGVPCDKTDVLIMGADDEKMHLDQKDNFRNKIRNEYSVEKTDFLITTGGKIDKKKNIIELMNATLNTENTKLLIFGKVMNDVKQEFETIIDNNRGRIIYIGWVDASQVYQYFYASDLVFFPGQHSVLWEQACASKVPCVFRKWDGMDHVDNGGNAEFVDDGDVDTLKDMINNLKYTEKYYSLLEKSRSDLTDIYLYSRIAQKSLESVIIEDEKHPF